MRSFTSLLTFAMVASSALASAITPSRTRELMLTIDGYVDPSTLGKRDNVDASKLLERDTAPPPFTNAQRLARGMPPLPPKRRWNGPARRATTSSGTTTTQTGLIVVTNPTTGVVLGYVAQNTADGLGHFGLTTSTNAAITFSITTQTSAVTSSQLNIGATTTTYAATYPYMGGIISPTDLGTNLQTGSPNFAFIQGTTATAPGSTAQTVPNSYPTSEPAESAIWTYNLNTNAVTAQWVNPGGSSPATSIVYIPVSNAFILTGDINSLVGLGTTTLVTFTFQNV